MTRKDYLERVGLSPDALKVADKDKEADAEFIAMVDAIVKIIEEAME